MNDRFQKLLAGMDEKLWLRMLVCFLPGLVLGKLAGQYPGAVLGVLGTGSLIIGAAIFVMWSRLRNLTVKEATEDEGADLVNAEAAAAAAHEPRAGIETAKLMTELLELFSSAGAEMIGAIETELLVSPKLSYAEAVEMAHRRKRLQSVKP
jgi:hypothetical protein